MNNKLNINEEELESFADAAVKYNVEKELKSKYAKILAEKKRKNTVKSKIFSIRSIAKIAAVLVVVFGSVFLFQQIAQEPSANAMAQKFVDQTNILGNPDITRKGASTASELQREANDAFTIKNYPLAIAKYEELEANSSISSLDKFYLGASYLKTKNYDKAISIFEDIKNTERKVVEEIDWFLSLAYVLLDKNHDAIPLLNAIISNNRYKANDAKILLNKIKK